MVIRPWMTISFRWHVDNFSSSITGRSCVFFKKLKLLQAELTEFFLLPPPSCYSLSKKKKHPPLKGNLQCKIWQGRETAVEIKQELAGEWGVCDFHQFLPCPYVSSHIVSQDFSIFWGVKDIGRIAVLNQPMAQHPALNSCPIRLTRKLPNRLLALAHRLFPAQTIRNILCLWIQRSSHAG